MSNILVGMARWLRHDLELEHSLRVQDLQLIKLGFSYDEAMNMDLESRLEYLKIGSQMAKIESYEQAFLDVEAAALGGGFTDKKTRKQLYSRWDKGLKKAVNSLEFGIEAGDPKDVNASASKHSPHRKAGVREFKSVMKVMAAKKSGQTL